jgi:hypothetical protein
LLLSGYREGGSEALWYGKWDIMFYTSLAICFRVVIDEAAGLGYDCGIYIIRECYKASEA